jgi:hypothetical protein
VDALVAWLEPRLPADGHFEAEGAQRFLASAIRAGSAETLGDLLGLAGLVDELGVRELGKRGPEELASMD